MGKLYYWAEGLDDYSSDNELPEYDKIIEIKRLNFFIGKNNAGKSRFLRSNFLTEDTSSNFNPISKNHEIFKRLHLHLDNFIDNKAAYVFLSKDLKKIQEIEIKKIFIELKNSIIDINLIADRKNYLIDKFEEYSKISFRKTNEHLVNNTFSNILSETIIFLKNYKFEENFFNKKQYIPIMRGMRPLNKVQDLQPYVSRTIFDYFPKNLNNKNQVASLAIITGESLYEELSKCLLGKPDKRKIIRQYEQKISQYFFDNQEVSLIPEYGEDLVSIKIGNDDQLAISQLGDGLQQAIILTYEAFIKQDETHAFFIEEPELHMHPGMLRQLMNFYLNETSHYYFFTTHSNHLLDMVDESNEVIIQKFTKTAEGKFQINRCDKDRDLLAALGVKPSSVYLANCTIWVEGITDRLYIAKYMQKYLEELEANGSGLYTKYRRFMPNYHYAFVEYAGGNIAHWRFDNDAADQEEDRGLTAKRIASDMLLIVDGDNEGKADRVQTLARDLGDQSFHIFKCKEIENTLPANIIIATAKDKFSRMQANTTSGFDISLLDANTTQPDFNHAINGIGRILDDAIWPAGSARTKSCFGESSGTIKDKLNFCRLALSMMEQENWELTPSAKTLCEKIFQHIESCNQP